MSTYASGYGEAAAVQGVVSGVGSFTAAAYLSLHNSTGPSTTGANEITTTGYSRQSITWGTANSTTGVVANSNSIAFNLTAAVTAIAYFGYWTASTSGTYSIGGLLSTSVTFGSAGGTLAIAAAGATLGANG